MLNQGHTTRHIYRTLKDKYDWTFSEMTFYRHFKEVIKPTDSSASSSPQARTTQNASSSSPSTTSSSGNNRSLEEHKRKFKMAQNSKPRKFEHLPPIDLNEFYKPVKD